jgi:hypothetical protein
LEFEGQVGDLRETLAAGAVAKVVADRHGISTGLIYT